MSIGRPLFHLTDLDGKIEGDNFVFRQVALPGEFASHQLNPFGEFYLESGVGQLTALCRMEGIADGAAVSPIQERRYLVACSYDGSSRYSALSSNTVSSTPCTTRMSQSTSMKALSSS